jgi:hypothetical protein
MTLTRQEKEAIALLRIGCSFADAAERSMLTVAYVMELWQKNSPQPVRAEG